MSDTGSDSELSDKARGLLRHSLGMASNVPRGRWGYRNYYAIGATEEGEDRRCFEGMVQTGHAKLKYLGERELQCDYFAATLKGAMAVGLHRAGLIRANLLTKRGKPVEPKS